MDKNYQNFVQAIKGKFLVEIKFISKSKGEIIRECAPLDFGKAESIKKDEFDRYHVYNIDSDHLLQILPNQIIYIKITNKTFNPADYVDLSNHKGWNIQRDWGLYS